MTFDLTTTLIAITTLLSVVGLQALVFWTRDRHAPWLGWLGFTFIFGSTGLLIYLLPAEGHEFAYYGGGNCLRIAAFAFFWQAARIFCGRPPELLVVALVMCLWLALCSFEAFLFDQGARVIVVSAISGVFMVLGAWELWRDRAEVLPSRFPAIVVYASFATVLFARIPSVGWAPFPFGAQQVSGAWLAGYGLVAFTHAMFLAGFMMSMTRERHELEQREFALCDPLTGLLNRRAFLDYAAQMGGRRKACPLALLVLDLDNFKLINDCHGHEAGDQMLQHFAAVARAATRPADLLYRMGGEEFCFVLPATEMATARAVADRVRTRFADSAIEVAGARIGGTVSVGIAAVEHGGFDLELLLAAGDAAVYEAKWRGRNQTVLADPHSLTHPITPIRAAVA